MKILYISYHYLPSTVANAKRPYCVVKQMLEDGHEVDLVRCKILDCNDECIHKHDRLKDIPVVDPIHAMQNKHGSGKISRIITAIIRGMMWPDVTILWTRKVMGLVDWEFYDKIVVSVLPMSAVMIGMYKKSNKKWFYDYQESVSPSFLKRETRRSPIFKLSSPLFQLIQKKVLERCGCVFFATKSYINDYLSHKLVQPSNVVHVPFFYDDDRFSKTNEQKGKKLKIAYFGSLSPNGKGRTPNAFLWTLGKLREQLPQAYADIEFHFYGRWPSRYDLLVEKLNLASKVKQFGQVSQKQYYMAMCKSDALLLLACKKDNLYVPSKMMDYIGSRRPILGYVPLESETYEILQEAKRGKYVVSEDNSDLAVAHLISLWKRWKIEKCSLMYDIESGEYWSSTLQVKRMIDCIIG